MPDNLAIGAFVLGAVLLLVSLLSGGFKIFGAEVSGTTGKAGRAIAFVLGLVFIITGFSTGGSTPAPEPDPAPSPVVDPVTPDPEPRPDDGAARPRPAANVVRPRPFVPEPEPTTSVRSLDISWTDGTNELQQIFAQLPQAELAVLTIAAASTGMDIYAFRLRITNTGGEAIAISPENIHIHYGIENVGATVLDHPRFLQEGRLQPNQVREGLVAFSARADIGAAIRFGGGSLSYDDDSIEVTYAGR